LFDERFFCMIVNKLMELKSPVSEINEVHRLSDVEEGRSVYILQIHGRGAFRQRIGEMGFVRGKMITVIKNAPLNDPIEFSLMGYNVSLRRKEAALVDVTTKIPDPEIAGQPVTADLNEKFHAPASAKVIRVALVGNPNCGKTTIFNYASGSQEHVGNYTGVTVSSKTATFRLDGTLFYITDLPGTYSISAYSPEELYVRDFILKEKPDVVVNIIDAANLERNLFLTTQLIDMHVKVVVALNMFDELLMNHDRFDYFSLGKMLGIPFVPTIGARGRGIHKLFRKVIEAHAGKDPYQRQVKINYGVEVEQSLLRIVENLQPSVLKDTGVSARFMALRLLSKDRYVETLLKEKGIAEPAVRAAHAETTRIEELLMEPMDSVITHARYGFISGALKETYHAGLAGRRRISDNIDNLLTHKYLGIPIFLFFMWLMFSTTFNVGKYPQDWLGSGVDWLMGFLHGNMPEGSFKHLLLDGIISGVGGVIVFLPNILIMFLFISIMEDTGYMARAAFITDKLMHKIGLHGQSFIPMLMGFGCNVPAIMATRTIENRNNRLLTMLLNPFMSCSARLPVYILLIGAVFPNNKGTILFAIYLTGILVAILVALAFKDTLFRSSEAPFVMELPPYRVPTSRSIIKHMWNRASQYLKKMGGVILIASVLIWALSHYPGNNRIANGVAPTSSVVSENSYIGRIGKFIEPAIAPLGFDWRMGVCLITGVTAKEIVVSTMGVIFQPETGHSEAVSLNDRIRQATYTTEKNKGKRVFTPLATVSFLIFTLLYFPCFATLVSIYTESGSWKWAAFSALFNTGLAYLLSLTVYQLGMLLI